MEEWRAIRDYEGLYEVSSCGRVRNSRTGRILKPQKSYNGYLRVNLYNKDGKMKHFSIHRLVLIAFRPCEGIENLEINHIDEDKSNNNLNNLEWCTHEYNMNHGTRKKRASKSHKEYYNNNQGILTDENNPNAKAIYCIELDKIYLTSKQASEELNISRSSISNHLHGRSKSCGGYHFIYV